MLLTEAQLHEIRDIIRDHHSAFIVHTVGPEAVSPDVLNRLKAKGLVQPTINSVEDAYLYGQLLAQMENPAVAAMGYEEFKQYLKKNPVALTPEEKQAVAMAKMNAAQYAVGLGNKVDLSTGATLIEADRKLAAKLKSDIKNKTEANVAKRETVKQLKSDLGHEAQDWARDWDRIAITEKQAAMQHGLADRYTSKYGPDVLVAKRPMPDACAHCKRLHLGPDGNPRIFKLSELAANGSNHGEKTANWSATIGPVHPHCQCQLIRIPAGWGFDKDGELVPGGRGGHGAGTLDDEDDSLEKTHTGPKLVIPLAKARISAEEAAEHSRAGDRSPGPGTAVNFVVHSPERQAIPKVEGWIEDLKGDKARAARDPLKRDKSTYEVAEPVKAVPKPIEVDETFNGGDQLGNGDAEKRHEDLANRHRRNVPPSNPVEVEDQKAGPKLVLTRLGKSGT